MSKNELLDIFIDKYYKHCISMMNDPYFGGILQKSKDTLILYFEENERIDTMLTHIFVSFIKNIDISYENYKIIIDEKEDINSYILFLISKTQ